MDEAGNCTGAIEIFFGRALRRRPAGLLNTFSNCCRNRGSIIKAGTGSALTSLSTKIAVAKGLFSGMQAAYAALQAGASASQAANAGLGAVVGIDRAYPHFSDNNAFQSFPRRCRTRQPLTGW